MNRLRIELGKAWCTECMTTMYHNSWDSFEWIIVELAEWAYIHIDKFRYKFLDIFMVGIRDVFGLLEEIGSWIL